MPRGKRNAPRHEYVFAAATVSVREPGSKYPTVIKQGEAWYADSPLVEAHPDLFSSDPPVVNPRGWSPPKVEQATAAPGEQRDSGRRGD